MERSLSIWPFTPPPGSQLFAGSGAVLYTLQNPQHLAEFLEYSKNPMKKKGEIYV